MDNRFRESNRAPITLTPAVGVATNAISEERVLVIAVSRSPERRVGNQSARYGRIGR
jgi:hypothetical protein